MCEQCEQTYINGFLKGLNLDPSSDFTKAINELASYNSSLYCKISKLERKLDILQANLCHLENDLDCNCCGSDCSCCCDESSCECPDSCSCKVKCSKCGTVNHVSKCCGCKDLCDCDCCDLNN